MTEDSQYEEESFAEPESSGIPAFVFDPFGVLRRRWLWMAAALVVGLAATTAVVSQITPIFAASATVMVTSQRISERFVRRTVEAGAFERINAILGEILSRSTLSNLIDQYGLYEDPEEPKPFEVRVALARENISVEEDRGMADLGRGAAEQARIYVITFWDSQPQRAAAVANDLANRFTTAHLELRGEQARLTTTFLRQALERTQKELADQESRITQFTRTHRGELPIELPSHLARLERLQEQSESLAIQIAEAEARLATPMSADRDAVALTPEARLLRLRSDLEQARAVRTEEHPRVLSLRRQVEELERELSAPTPSSSGALQTQQATAALRIQQLQSQRIATDLAIQELDARVARTPERQEELASLERRAEVLRARYQEFLRKVQAAELAESVESAQQGERAMILDNAVPPTTPEQPRWMSFAVGVLGSVGLAVAVACLLELLDVVLVRADQIEDEFGIGVVGSVGRIT